MTDKNLTHNLNDTGIFLELAFLNFLKQYQYLQKETQVPYTINRKDLEPINGVIDFLCFFPSSNQPIIYFIIECKKADPSRKSWIFFKRHEDEPSIIFYKDNVGSGNIHRAEHPEVIFRAVCDRGLQIADTKKTQAFQHVKDLIYAAAIQANTGMLSVIYDEKRYERTQDELVRMGLLRDWPILYIPLVVTTANLSICDVNNDGDINIGSGEAEPGGPTYEQVNQVEYSVPIPEKLQICGVDRRTTFIVNSQHLQEFFKGLIPRLVPFYKKSVRPR